MSDPKRSTLRLILWPSLITLAISVARCTLQVRSDLSTASGGSLLPLGISWLGFVFGGWFALRLPGRPRTGKAWLLCLVALLALVTAVGIGFGGIDRVDRSEAAFESLRVTVLAMVGVSCAGASLCFYAWPRLALVCLAYAVPARLTVLAITALAHQQSWDTHYTKFGPAGIELEGLGETMLSASAAQLGFWVPWTVITGSLTGCLVATLRSRGGSRA